MTTTACETTACETTTEDPPSDDHYEADGVALTDADGRPLVATHTALAVYRALPDEAVADVWMWAHRNDILVAGYFAGLTVDLNTPSGRDRVACEIDARLAGSGLTARYRSYCITDSWSPTCPAWCSGDHAQVISPSNVVEGVAHERELHRVTLDPALVDAAASAKVLTWTASQWEERGRFDPVRLECEPHPTDLTGTPEQIANALERIAFGTYEAAATFRALVATAAAEHRPAIAC